MKYFNYKIWLRFSKFSSFFSWKLKNSIKITKMSTALLLSHNIWFRINNCDLLVLKYFFLILNYQLSGISYQFFSHSTFSHIHCANSVILNIYWGKKFWYIFPYFDRQVLESLAWTSHLYPKGKNRTFNAKWLVFKNTTKNISMRTSNKVQTFFNLSELREVIEKIGHCGIFNQI